MNSRRRFGSTQYIIPAEEDFTEIFHLVTHAGVAAEFPHLELGDWLEEHGLRGLPDAEIAKKAEGLPDGHAVQIIVLGSAHDRRTTPQIDLDAFAAAQRTLRWHADAVCGVAQALLENETLSGDQICRAAGLLS